MSQRLQIMPYDPSWASEFETERDLVSHALGQLARRIDHSGSTAVPGLEAKPIIDIQVSVEKLNPIRAYAEPLAGLGYRHIPMMQCVRSSTGQANGLIRIIFTLLNRVDSKSGEPWHFATTYVVTATRTNTGY